MSSPQTARSKYTITSIDGRKFTVEEVGENADGSTRWCIDGISTTNDLLIVAEWMKRRRPYDMPDDSTRELRRMVREQQPAPTPSPVVMDDQLRRLHAMREAMHPSHGSIPADWYSAAMEVRRHSHLDRTPLSRLVFERAEAACRVADVGLKWFLEEVVVWSDRADVTFSATSADGHTARRRVHIARVVMEETSPREIEVLYRSNPDRITFPEQVRY